MKKRQNYVYAYGMFVLSIVSILAGSVSIYINQLSPYGAGCICMGLLLIAQYLREMERASQSLIRILTWIAAIGFFIVDVILIYNLLRR